MTSAEIRIAFLEFFRSKEHQIVPSAPMVVKNDPTLMFTNAGMNQFKDIFLGNSPVKYKRIANTQKCLRVSGKHNDLEEVGIDTYHHTMFEMLGNWSFGDYFKKEAIAWSWELLTEIYKLPKDRLYVTVFEGDPKEKLSFDQESYDCWKALIAEDRILKGNKKDNFWEMGDQGPCGPCTEIHVDLRSEEERKKVDGKNLVNASHPQVIEIWNNVFMEFNRKADSSLEVLPAQHVDTGMGFERLCMALQGKTSNYDTDVFQPMIQFIAARAGIKYGADEKTDIAMRVMVDHIRAITFAIGDGQLPSNNKAGYVIRRILRRAVRYAFTFLNFKEPFLNKLVPLLAEQFKDIFPEVKSQQDFIQRVVQEEEQGFLRTLDTGIRKFEENKSKNISGEFAFELYDTFGFPIDLTQLMAREKGIDVDMDGFSKNLEKQKERSRAAASMDTDDWVLLREESDVEFVGYDEFECDCVILRYRKVKSKTKEQFQLVLNKTPFYAESGGQVGDTGTLVSANERVIITDTQKENNLIIHFCDKLPEDLLAKFNAGINHENRRMITNNHSATHLMHSALKKVLGEHVNQKGSLVNAEHTRFDFSHFSKVTDEEIARIEKMVNEKIRENIQLDEQRNVPVQKALEMGATALFGEKYGETVRVITFDPTYSRELCGGTHVPSTGQIGLFKIVSEGAVAAGVRRIEAITADKADAYFKQQEDKLKELNELLKNPKDLSDRIRQILEENVALQENINQIISKKAQGIKNDLISRVKEVNGINVIVDKLDLPTADSIKNISFELKNQIDNLFFLAGAEIDGKAHLSLIISETLIKDKNLNAKTIISELSKEIQGGGGGQPFYATAGGKNPNGIEKALEKGRSLVLGLK
ncbi:MAG: alanine--tRNA ligase [Bacteroidetes bacterium]|nr:alanine--tRNA ligase [Bacteroidota bacterium]